MKPIVFVLLAAAAAAAATPVAAQPTCATPSPTAPWMLVQRQTLSEEDGAWRNDSLRSALMKAAGMKSGAVALQLGWEKPAAPDTSPNSALDFLRSRAAQPSGWPSRGEVGLAGLRAIFILAARDTGVARVALERMKASGRDGAIKPDVAVLEDRVRVAQGRPQLYGTQLVEIAGRFIPATIEDSATVDARRRAANLPPLAWSVCNANVGNRE
jgi:hypothetical protein